MTVSYRKIDFASQNAIIPTMHTHLENKLRHFPRPCLSDVELETVFDGNLSPDSRYSKIKRLVMQHKLLHMRRGLYCLTDAIGYPAKPHPFELASYIYGPSYISLESALSYHGLIPELVVTTTSVCTKRSKTFHTPLGVFSFSHLPEENFLTEVALVEENHYQFFIAKPWKAIADYVYCYKKDWLGIEPLLQSLRIDFEDLPALSDKELASLDAYYHQRRLSRFLKGVYRGIQQK